MSEGQLVVPTLDRVDGPVYEIIVLAAFLLGFLLLFCYCVCERAPCNVNPTHEERFFKCLALILLLATCAVYYAVWEPWPLDGRVRNMVIFSVYTFQSFISHSKVALMQYKGPTPTQRSRAADRLGHALIAEVAEIHTPLHLFPGAGSASPLVLKQSLPVLWLMLIFRLTCHPSGALQIITSTFLWAGAAFIVGSWFLRFLRSWSKRERRVRIASLLQRMLDMGVANDVLCMVNCPELVAAVGNLKLVTDLCKKLLVQEESLCMHARAVLIDALAKTGLGWGVTPAERRRQDAIVDIFMATKGEQLTKLKNYCDMNGDVYNLVFITQQLTTRRRRQLLQHFRIEAAECVDPLVIPLRTKVLSDIDDTLYSSGGHFPAGCDQRWPKKAFYPGVMSFYRSLDRYHLGTKDLEAAGAYSTTLIVMQGRDKVDHSHPGVLTPGQCKHLEDLPRSVGAASHVVVPTSLRLGLDDVLRAAVIPKDTGKDGSQAALVKLTRVDESNLVFLSARPHVHKNIAESATYKVFWSLVRSGKLHTMPSLLPGSLWAGAKALIFSRCFQGAWRSVGMKKFEMFKTYASLYLEYSFIFVGDNGQGDVLAAEQMTANNPNVRACFIHEVRPMTETLTSLQSPDIESWEKSRIFFFRSYVGAAIAAMKIGLITKSDLQEVARDAVQDLEESRYVVSMTGNLAAGVALETALEQDLKTASEILMEAGMPAVPAKSASMVRADSVPATTTLGIPNHIDHIE